MLNRRSPWQRWLGISGLSDFANTLTEVGYRIFCSCVQKLLKASGLSDRADSDRELDEEKIYLINIISTTLSKGSINIYLNLTYCNMINSAVSETAGSQYMYTLNKSEKKEMSKSSQRETRPPERADLHKYSNSKLYCMCKDSVVDPGPQRTQKGSMLKMGNYF